MTTPCTCTPCRTRSSWGTHPPRPCANTRGAPCSTRWVRYAPGVGKGGEDVRSRQVHAGGGGGHAGEAGVVAGGGGAGGCEAAEPSSTLLAGAGLLLPPPTPTGEGEGGLPGHVACTGPRIGASLVSPTVKREAAWLRLGGIVTCQEGSALGNHTYDCQGTSTIIITDGR